MDILLKNKQKNQVKFGKLGFSFTTLFFGIFVSLFRRDWKVFLPLFILYMSALYFTPIQIITVDGFTSLQMVSDGTLYAQLNGLYTFIVNILGAFFYNRLYTQGLVNKGYLPVSLEAEALLQAHHIKLPYSEQE